MARLQEKTLIYFDPPYYTKGKALYLNFYGRDDHISVANRISKIDGQKWVITYDRIDFIEKLYSRYRQINYALNYSASKARKGEELMIFSDNLKIPDFPQLLVGASASLS